MTWKTLRLLALLAVLAGRAELALAFDDCTLCGGSDVPGSNNPPESKPPPDNPPPCPATSGSGSGNACKEKTASPPACAGDPVALGGGSINISRTDFELPGIIPIRMDFNYHSSSNIAGHFGFGWYFNYEMRIKADEDGNYFLRTESGAVRKYSPVGEQIAGEASQDLFKVNSNGTYTLERFNGRLYEFNSWGTLSFVTDRSGNYLHFIYEDGGTGNPVKMPIYGTSRNLPYTDYFEIAGYDYRLKRIENGASPANQSVDFRYNSFGYVDQVTDHAGRTFTYSYDPNFGTLQRVTNAVGEFVYYNYNPSSPLQVTSFINQARCNQDGNELVSNEYGTDGRISRQTFNGKDLLFSPITESSSQSQVVIGSQTTTRTTGVARNYLTTKNFDAYGNLLNTLFTTYIDSTIKFNPPVAPSETYRIKIDSFDVILPNLSTAPQVIKEVEVINQKGLLVKKIKPDGSYSQFKYDARLRLTEELMSIFNPVSMDTGRYFVRTTYFSNTNLPTRISTGEIGIDSTFTNYEYDPISYNLRFEKIPIDPSNPFTNLVKEYRYDNRGLKVEVIDFQGNSSRFEYDGVAFGTPNNVGTGFLTAKIDQLGNKTTLVNNPIGSPLYETDSKGGQKTWNYDAMGKPIRVCDEDGICTVNTYLNSQLIRSEDGVIGSAGGRITRFEYDQNGRLTRKVRIMEDGSEFILAGMLYDADGRIVREYDQAGVRKRFEYDAMGRVVSEIDSLNHITRLFHDVNGNLYAKLDPVGNLELNVFDGLGRLLKKTDPNNSVLPPASRKSEKWVFGFRDVPSVEEDPLGNVVHYKYDGLDRKIFKVGFISDTTLWGYTGERLTSIRTPEGRLTRFTYDKVGHMLQKVIKIGDNNLVRDANDWVEEYQYDKNGKLLREVRQGVIARRLGYNLASKLISDTDGVGSAISIEYYPTGEIKDVKLPTGAQFDYFYDNLGRLIRTTDPLGIQRTSIFDARGNTIEDNFPGKGSILREYDGAGGLTKSKDSAGIFTQFTLDGNGQIIETQNNLGYKTKSTLDGLSRIITREDERGFKINTAFDDLGRIISIKDNEDHETKISYLNLPMGVRKTTIFPDNRTEIEEFNRERELVSRIDPKGQRSDFSYDTLGHLCQIHVVGGATIRYKRDPQFRMNRMEKGGITTQYSFDMADRVISMVQTLDGKDFRFDYSYDDATNTDKIKYPGGMTLIVKKDIRNRISRQMLGTRLVHQYVYDGFKLEKNILGNGLTENYVSTPSGKAEKFQVTGGTGVFPAFDVGYGASGNVDFIRKYHDASRSQSYGYDSSGQITSYREGQLNASNQISNPSLQSGWSFDSRGNWTQISLNGAITSRNHDILNSVQSEGALQATYDDAGNLLSYAGNSFSWDPEGHLASANGYQYEYGADGNRAVARAPGGNATYFVADGSRILYEETSSGDSKSFIYGSYIDEPIAVVLKRSGIQDTMYYIQGINYNVEALANSTGSLVEVYEYAPFGKPKIHIGPGVDGQWYTTDDQIGSASLFGNYYMYQGRQFDSESGLFYFRNRYFSTTLGRFISRDPAGYKSGDVNLYRFVHNHPFSRDPYGLKETCRILSVVRYSKSEEIMPGEWLPDGVKIIGDAGKIGTEVSIGAKNAPGMFDRKSLDWGCVCRLYEVGEYFIVRMKSSYQEDIVRECCTGDECSKRCNQQKSSEIITDRIWKKRHYEEHPERIYIETKYSSPMATGPGGCTCGSIDQ
ncbi:MAG: repeat protein [Fibrobacteres bacterium]|nr:repeat protein [Fibrobacterota bacterium]